MPTRAQIEMERQWRGRPGRKGHGAKLQSKLRYKLQRLAEPGLSDHKRALLRGDVARLQDLIAEQRRAS